MQRTVWAGVENEHGRIGLDAALKLGERFLVTLDWVYKGDEFALPHGLVMRLREAAEAEARKKL